MEYADGARIINLADEEGAVVTLYAKWGAQYTVTFIAAGGTVSPATKTVADGGFYGDLPTPTKAGSGFVGWYTQPEGGGARITAGSVVNLTADQALYAKWTADIYTVTLDARGGVVDPASVTVNYGAYYWTTVPIPEMDGYHFGGWYTEVDGGGTQITATTQFLQTTDQTLYAKWTENTYTVTFDPQGGSVSPSSKNVTYGGTYGELPTPDYLGCTFGGWYTGTDGGGEQITDSTAVTVTAEAQTLYAQWTADAYTVTFDAQGGSVSPASKDRDIRRGVRKHARAGKAGLRVWRLVHGQGRHGRKLRRGLAGDNSRRPHAVRQMDGEHLYSGVRRERRQRPQRLPACTPTA